MCIICVELAKQSMTPSEARRALREMTVKLDQAHVAEVETKLKEAEAAATKP
jgi:NACalpha-BTF3-like transcription factor